MKQHCYIPCLIEMRAATTESGSGGVPLRKIVIKLEKDDAFWKSCTIADVLVRAVPKSYKTTIFDETPAIRVCRLWTCWASE